MCRSSEGSAELPPDLAGTLTIIRQPRGDGNIAGRNEIMRAATHENALLRDDDACLLDAGTIREVLAMMEARSCGSSRGLRDGRAGWRPGRTHAGRRPSSISLLHPVVHRLRASDSRARAFLEVGGYRAMYRFHGEEKDCCLRLMDAGYDIVYLPDPPVMHLRRSRGARSSSAIFGT